MNFAKVSVVSAVFLSAFAAQADAGNALITFSTPGIDCYADGTRVRDGEIYALVWSKDGNFDGFTATGEAADPADKVFFKAGLAKDGKCGLTVFQVSSDKAPKGGEYAVYLLDTRAGNGLVTGSALAKTYDMSASSETSNVPEGKGEVAGVKTTAAGLAGDTAPIAPVITGIKIEGSQITISVGNLVPGLSYTVMGGLKRDSEVKKVGFGEAREATVVFESDEKFFSIKAE